MLRSRWARPRPRGSQGPATSGWSGEITSTSYLVPHPDFLWRLSAARAVTCSRGSRSWLGATQSKRPRRPSRLRRVRRALTICWLHPERSCHSPRVYYGPNNNATQDRRELLPQPRATRRPSAAAPLSWALSCLAPFAVSLSRFSPFETADALRPGETLGISPRLSLTGSYLCNTPTRRAPQRR